MSKTLLRDASTGRVTYTLKPKKAGRSTFSDVKLPNGKVIRRVDESVHRKGITSVKQTFKGK